MNSRTAKHIEELRLKGWDAKGTNDTAIVDENMAQLFTYWPHNDFLTMSTFSVDRFMQLLSDMDDRVPAHANNANAFAMGVMELGLKAQKEKSLKTEEDLAIILAMYASKTKAYAQYTQNLHGMPFAFFAIMYPKSKKFNDFAVKPAMLAPWAELLKPEQAIEYGNLIMDSDRTAGKKEFFKHLKKRK